MLTKGMLIVVLSIAILVSRNFLEICCNSSIEVAYTLVYHQEHLNFETAKATCKLHGGTLPIVKNNIIQEILADVPSLRDVSVWIGLTFINESWQWHDGTTFVNSHLPLEDKAGSCVAVWLNPDGALELQQCMKALPFFCQYVQGSCYFKTYRQTSIVGHNKFSLTGTSLRNCQDVCDHVTEFECASFEYNTANNFCQLNSKNRWTAADDFVYYDLSWDYYHKTCYRTTILPEDSDQTRRYSVSTDMYDGTTELHSTTITTDPNLQLIRPKRYVVHNESLSWLDAALYCKTSGGQLAIFNDPSNFPETGYQNIYHLNELYWIGLKKLVVQGWQWIDSSQLKWSNFKYKPNEFDLITVCSTVSLSTGWWYTAVCDERKQFICQYETDSCNFVPTANASIIAHNDYIYPNISMTKCQDECIAAVLCRSYEYNTQDRICQISSVNRWSAAEYYHTRSLNWIYVHRQCNFGITEMTETSTAISTTDYATTTVDETNANTEYLTTLMETSQEAVIVHTSTAKSTTEERFTTTKIEKSSLEAKTTVSPTVIAERMFQEIKQELIQIGTHAKKKNLDRRRTSATDDRASARGVGIAAVIMLVGLCGSIVVLDFSTMSAQCKQFSTKTKRLSSRYKGKNKYVHENNNSHEHLRKRIELQEKSYHTPTLKRTKIITKDAETQTTEIDSNRKMTLTNDKKNVFFSSLDPQKSDSNFLYSHDSQHTNKSTNEEVDIDSIHISVINTNHHTCNVKETPQQKQPVHDHFSISMEEKNDIEEKQLRDEKSNVDHFQIDLAIKKSKSLLYENCDSAAIYSNSPSMANEKHKTTEYTLPVYDKNERLPKIYTSKEHNSNSIDVEITPF